MEQSQLTQKKILTLIGRLETPIVTPKAFFKKWCCWVKIVGDPLTDKKPIFTPIGKLVKGAWQVPTSLHGYRGYVRITCVERNVERGKKRLERFLQQRFLGNLTAEGFGQVSWLHCTITDYQVIRSNPKKKLKVRKGLGVNYPHQLQRLLLALMLHDFVHTDNHNSKIYEQVTIHDEELLETCLKHHDEENGNNYLPAVKYYDGLASAISRKHPYPSFSRYDYPQGRIDFKQLAQEIEERQDSAYKLYNFIYHSNELRRIVESLSYSKNSLRNHLLLMVNLAINDYLSQKLIIRKGTIILKQSRNRQLLARNHGSAKDAEMHSIPDHEQR